MSEQTWQRWLPDAGLGLVVVLVGLLEIANRTYTTTYELALVVIAILMGIAVGLSRHAPAAALALVWLMGVAQVVGEIDLLLVEVAIAIVAFGCARWGSSATAVLSGLSIPAAAVILVVYIGVFGLGVLASNLGFETVVESAFSYDDRWQVAAAVIGMALLGVPWLAGLALRYVARAQTSRVHQVAAEDEAARARHDRAQAEEIARLREEQNRLARDVHDVVGHSLAVILAQAESAQYLQDADTERLKKTMETIATSARESLQDVRQVLTPADRRTARPGSLEELIAGVKGSGHEVVATEVGTPQPLPPELETVAYRVLQEMLTNAIKHGRRDAPVLVERHWPDGAWQDELRIEVRNASPALDETQPIGLEKDTSGGQGLEGMRRRLDSVGGRLDVRPRVEAEGPTFTVTAWVPVRPR